MTHDSCPREYLGDSFFERAVTKKILGSYFSCPLMKLKFSVCDIGQVEIISFHVERGTVCFAAVSVHL